MRGTLTDLGASKENYWKFETGGLVSRRLGVCLQDLVDKPMKKLVRIVFTFLFLMSL
jgi:hypothetical protein